MIAIKRLQSIMWILIVAMGALSAYLISLRVATERNAVKELEAQIYRTRANIRYLEVEFSARASMRQLEAWNAQDIRYSVPTASQYLADEQQLAALDRIAPSGQPYVAPPVMAEMAQAEPAPATMAPVKAEAPARHDTQSDFSLIKSAVAAEPVAVPVRAAVVRTAVATAEASPAVPPKGGALKAGASKVSAPKANTNVKSGGDERVAKAKPASDVRLAKAATTADPSAKRATRLALLDQKLLDTTTLRHIDPAGGAKALR